MPGVRMYEAAKAKNRTSEGLSTAKHKQTRFAARRNLSSRVLVLANFERFFFGESPWLLVSGYQIKFPKMACTHSQKAAFLVRHPKRCDPLLAAFTHSSTFLKSPILVVATGDPKNRKLDRQLCSAPLLSATKICSSSCEAVEVCTTRKGMMAFSKIKATREKTNSASGGTTKT